MSHHDHTWIKLFNPYVRHSALTRVQYLKSIFKNWNFEVLKNCWWLIGIFAYFQPSRERKILETLNFLNSREKTELLLNRLIICWCCDCNWGSRKPSRPRSEPKKRISDKMKTREGFKNLYPIRINKRWVLSMIHSLWTITYGFN